MKTKVSISEALISKRNRAIKKMCPEMRYKLDWIIEWCKTEQRHSIMSRWTLGAEVIDIRNKFGEKNYKALRLFIPEDPSMLQKVETFATYYSKEEAEQLADLVMADGNTLLSYSHVRLLISIENEVQRKEAINLILINCWTSAQLGAHIKTLLGKRSKGGRKPAVPKDARTVIDQQLAFVEDFENRNVNVWRNPTHSLTAQVAKIEPKEYTEDLAKQLGRLAHQMRQLATEATVRADEAERKYSEIKRVLDVGAVDIPAAAELDNEWEDVDNVVSRKLRDTKPINKDLVNAG